jgi:hypothetical protein
VAYTSGSNAKTGSPVSSKFRVVGGKLCKNFLFLSIFCLSARDFGVTGRLNSSTTNFGLLGPPVCQS